MIAIFVFILFILIFTYCLAKLSLSLNTWLITLSIVLVVFKVSAIFPAWLIGIFAIILILFCVFGLYEPLRRHLLSKPMYQMMKKAMPPMSQTEREAIEAGTVGFEAQLFNGAPDWSQLFSISKPQLTLEEQSFLNNEVVQFCDLSNSWETSLHKDLSIEQWHYLKSNGFFGLGIPKSYGGLEFSEDGHAAVITKIASQCVVSAVTVMVPNSLGPAKLLLYYGTQQQRDYYLPRLAKGEEIPCFALTGPFAGSDAGAIPDCGILCEQLYEGTPTLGFRITLDKRYITLAPIATLIGLAFKAFDPDHLLGDLFEKETDLGVTCALLPATVSGLEIGNRLNPLYNHFYNGTIKGKDVFVPLSWVIGGRDNIGKGWKMLVDCLSIGRGISLPGLANASGKKMALVTGAYARIRKQFNQPISKFQGVAEQLAEIGKQAYVMDAACKLITGSLRDHQKPAILSSMVKYYNTEQCRSVVNIAMDIHGGKGIIAGPNNYLSQNYMSLPIAITVEGANILTRSLMIFGQGALRSHPFLQKEMKVLAECQSNSIEAFDQLLQQHISYSLKNKARAFIYGITGGLLAPKSEQPIANELESYIKKVNQLSAALAFSADFSFICLGGSLKRQESATGHFSDLWTAMTMVAAVLKKYQDEGAHKEDFPIVRLACDDLLHQGSRALDKLLDNFPINVLGKLLKLVVAPWGSAHHAASDQLRLQVATLLTTDSATLQRLTAGVYVPMNGDHAIAQLLATRDKMADFDLIEMKIKRADRIYHLLDDPKQWLANLVQDHVLSQSEADFYQDMQYQIKKVIDVDEFKAEDY